MTNTTDRPPGQLSLIGEKLFTLTQEAADLANEHTEVLNFGDYATLCEIETKLLAYGNLLETRDRETFLEDEIRHAEEILTTFRQWTGSSG